MLDNQLIQIFYPIIQNGLIDQGLTNITLRQSYNPTQQGASSGGVVYFYKISDHRYGSLGVLDVWDLNALEMRHSEIQNYESTFQVSAMWIQNPNDINGLTASDLVNEVSQILQDVNTINILKDNDIGILRITDIRNPYFRDDYDNFEASPSFDFTLSHKQKRLTISPIISSISSKIYRV